MSGAAVIGAAGLASIELGPAALVVMGVAAIGVLAMAAANNKADTQLSTARASTPCYDCGDGPDCFKPPKNADEAQKAVFRRQLKGQQDGINQMSPDEVTSNIDRYSNMGREGANPGEQQMRDSFRKGAWENNYNKHFKAFGDEQAATEYADQSLGGKAALHNPDMRAGGGPMPTDLGNAKVNSSLGSQWAKTGPSSRTTRWVQLRKAAEQAKRVGKKLMDIDLKEC